MTGDSLMKLSKMVAAGACLTAALTMTACSSDSSESTSSSSTTSASSASTDLPTAAELNELIEKASDQSVPLAERVQLVEGGEDAPEIFDSLAQSKQETGATFTVVDPILPGYTSNSALATVTFSAEGRQPQTADNVEFVYEDGQWKLAKNWACTLVTNVVDPSQVPATCQDGAATEASSEAPAQ
ncbi:MAG: hypothetical protein Q3972_05240 [Corynebacterium sp.]|nr:hypothetical protein [Corynebacterium sp.]